MVLFFSPRQTQGLQLAAVFLCVREETASGGRVWYRGSRLGVGDMASLTLAYTAPPYLLYVSGRVREGLTRLCHTTDESIFLG